MGEDGMKMTQSYAGGLDQLNSLDRILVQQKMELCEVITGWEQKNKYQICSSNGEEIFFMREENSCCTRQCCGPNRPFNFHVTDPAGLEVLHFKRFFQTSYPLSLLVALLMTFILMIIDKGK